jgi:hypothetical protein
MWQYATSYSVVRQHVLRTTREAHIKKHFRALIPYNSGWSGVILSRKIFNVSLAGTTDWHYALCCQLWQVLRPKVICTLLKTWRLRPHGHRTPIIRCTTGVYVGRA